MTGQRGNKSNSTIVQRHEIDWNDDDQIIQYVESRWEAKDQFKRGLERRWLEIISAYEGMPYLGYDETFRILTTDAKIPPWRVKLVVNLLLPYIRTAAAKHLRNRPTWDVIPATTDSKDYDIASAGKKTLRGFWYTQGLNYSFIDILLWLGLTGNAFAYSAWDPDAGPQMELEWQDFVNPQALEQAKVYSQQDPEAIKVVLLDAQSKFNDFVKANNSNILPLGENSITIPTPFDMLFPWASNFYKVPWLIESCVREISHFVDLGYDAQDFREPTQKEARYLYYARRIDNLNNLGGYSSTDVQADNNTERQVLELRLWLPRSRQFPKGYHCVIAGGKVIAKGENPYRHGLIPYIHFGAERTPGKVWHFSSSEQAMSVLRQYQKTKSQIVEIKNLMSKPKWLVSRQANLLKTAITSEPGEIIEYTGQFAPQPWQPPAVPRYLFDLMAIDRRDMDEIMAQRDATKGMNPAGVRSAAALSNLQGADDGQQAIIGLNLDTGFSLMGRMVLSNYAQFIREDRLTTYVGDRNRYESVALKQGSLEGPNARLIGADYFNVRVTQFSQFGLTREGQMRLLEVLLQYQVYTPADRAKILEFMQLGYFEDQLDEFKKDRANANRENLIMAQGQELPVDFSDKDDVHVEEHFDFMKGDDFRQLPPEIQQMFTMHIRRHQGSAIRKVLEPQIMAIPIKLQLAAEYNLPPELVLMGENNGTQRQPSNNRQSSDRTSSGKSDDNR